MKKQKNEITIIHSFYKWPEKTHEWMEVKPINKEKKVNRIIDIGSTTCLYLINYCNIASETWVSFIKIQYYLR